MTAGRESLVDDLRRQVVRGEAYFASVDLLTIVDYLTERLEMRADYHGLTGASSDAMVLAALTGEGPWVTDYPLDRSDWRRCLLAYARAPVVLRERMRPMMRLYRESLEPERRRWSQVWQHPKPGPYFHGKALRA